MSAPRVAPAMARMRAVLAALIGLAALLAAPAAAQLDQVLGSPTPKAGASSAPASPAGQIADTQDAGSDVRIAGRIRGIFAELPAFARVTVGVRQGVVTLSGTVPQQADVARAEAIAGRVSGVVTVDNGLHRDISLGANTGSLATVKRQAQGIVRVLPLLAVALALAAAIAAIGYALAGLKGLWRRVTPNVFLAELVASAIRFVFVLAGIVIALNMLGAGALLGAVLGGAGVIGLALGFALRDTIENYVASLMLSLRQPFRPNDHVTIDTHEGRIIRLTSRATIMMTLEGNHLRLPNSQVFKAVILNFSRNPRRRFEFVLQIDTKADPVPAQAAGLKALAGQDFVLADPPPVALVADVLYPNIAITFRGWVDQTQVDFKKARARALVAVNAALNAAGFAIPDPVTHVEMLDTAPAGQGPPAPPPQTSPREVPAAPAEDVAPEPAVEAMVAAERSETPDKDDLLDSSKPVE